ncbi:MAG: DUF1318 domain-containing protein [Alphaproteobacteria bacterium]|nr:DUF1318 domain-containing protein [Alphaproteobacteria bacterium]
MLAGTIRTSLFSLLAVLALLLSSPVQADALDDALQKGLVGETPRGYVAPVKSPSAAVTKLVNDINARRRAAYQNIAKKNGLTLQKVEAVAGARVIQRAPAGTYYKNSSGAWQRK